MQQFACCPSTDSPHANDCSQSWAHEIQSYLRQRALKYCLLNPRARDQRLLLIEDGSALVGAVVHALTDADDPQGIRDRVIVVYAVALSHQGKQLSDGRRASHAVLDAAVADAVSRHEQETQIVLNALVDPRNVSSCACLRSYGLLPRGRDSSGEYILHSARLT
ncbi:MULTISPECIES: hypothetical protein [Streptomyces]|uniref:hypothetical protein n=1 Tax=Streptomyces TaxID=1883 RepID=UPI002030A130|nr:hypothetical protein [Streptomyces sp. G1]MCM1973195.1 hypothetical protein [Streptomyces sp. G1]